MSKIQRVAALIFTYSCLSVGAQAADFAIHEFEKQELTPIYWSEGANFGDFNKDGHQDVVSGPDIYLGPDFENRYEFYPAVAPTRRDPNDRSYYANNNFFSFVFDFNADGWPDVLTVGLPNTEAYWYQNPGKSFSGAAPNQPVPPDQPGHWERHFVIDRVKNESPVLGDLTGDGVPELLTAYGKHYGYAAPNPVAPTLPWIFHPVSTSEEEVHHYTHGMGYGDVDGDGRNDLLTGDGWLQQPASLQNDPDWAFHPFPFADRTGADPFNDLRGGGQMFAYDVNGDELNDVVTSLDAHGWGLAWFEQSRTGKKITFQEHLILSKQEKNTDNPYGVQFSQLHAVELVDIDGDGLKDIVTGMTYRAHEFSDPGSRQAPVIYYFRLTRQDDQVEFVPYLIDDKAGIGRLVVSGDINKDELIDLVVGNKNGTFVFTQKVRNVDREEWEKAQPVRQD